MYWIDLNQAKYFQPVSTKVIALSDNLLMTWYKTHFQQKLDVKWE